MTKSNALSAIIKDRIRAGGPMTFRDYMQAALYEPELGYYSSGKTRIGRDGDFYTSPTSTPLFGKLLARWLAERLREIGPGHRYIDGTYKYAIIEIGSGTGDLRMSIRQALQQEAPDIAGSLHYITSEYGSTVPDGPDRACVISNELIDAFPVHRVKQTEKGLREIYVALDPAGDFIEIEEALSTPDLQAYFETLDVVLPPGYSTEVNLQAVQWLKDNARLQRQYLLTIDYGYESAELYAPYRSEGTLIGYHRHEHTDNLYTQVGEQDLTSHVNFSALMEFGRQAGLEAVAFMPQSEFLRDLGAMELLEKLNQSSVSDTSALKSYLALKDLVMPDGMGGVFKVLVQSKGVYRPV
jgi:SAM-dependent MidA family methyltransferase